MYKLIALVLYFTLSVHGQLSQEEERSSGNPTRYVLPYAGLTDEPPESLKDEEQYYKSNRRSERIPATSYQYDESVPEDEYYRPQPRQKIEPENYRYQTSTPSHKDYEQILKHNHLVRMRVQAKKQSQPHLLHPQLQSQPVEQYLKEVNPTTKTTYQRPSNYLRFSGQGAGLKQELSEENAPKPQQQQQQQYRYVLQSDLQQKPQYPQYQYEPQEPPKTPPPPPKPTTPHFNLVAYQNALIAQQKLLAAASQDDSTSKSSIYVSQNIKKPSHPPKKQKAVPSRPSSQQYEYYPQVPPQPQAPQRQVYSPELPPLRYQQPANTRNLYQKSENSYQVEDPLLYPEQKEEEYQTQAPIRAPKQRTTRIPTRKPKYQTEESSEYQSEEQSFDYPAPAVKYQEEQPLNYRRPSTRRPSKPVKYSSLEESEEKQPESYLQYQPQLSKYQPESLARRPAPPQYQQEAEEVRQAPTRYLQRQQYQEETQQRPQYHQVDLSYQPTADVPVTYRGRGPSVSYRQQLENSSVRYYRNLEAPISYDE